MPNLKIYVDEDMFPNCREALIEALLPIRGMLCEELDVPVSACQFAVIPAIAMADLPRVNVEIQILPRPERTRDKVIAVCERLQKMVVAATSVHTAVRVSFLDPASYIALK